MAAADMEKIKSLCKRRGFIFPSSEIYGGLESTWDYGPLGVELKNNVKRAWWKSVVYDRDDMEGLDAAILMNRLVWKYSGHEETFTDPLVDCKECKSRFRSDHLIGPSIRDGAKDPAVAIVAMTILSAQQAPEATAVSTLIRDKISGNGGTPKNDRELISQAWLDADLRSYLLLAIVKLWQFSHERFFAELNAGGVLVCPNCGATKAFTPPRRFNLMFKTFMGPVEEDAALVYLRPETAQGIFVNFVNVQQTMRRKLPFGIAQIGKAFRNEITPGNFTFRTREFEQMEIEFFVRPGEDEQWFERWVEDRFNWYVNLGLRSENLRRREQEKAELAHYAKRTIDIEYLFPMGWSELEGVANRTDFDLNSHSKSPVDADGKRKNPDSTGDLTYFDEEKKEHITPYVIEPSAGADRATLAFLFDSYIEEEVKGETRVVLRLHQDLAPIKAAIFPLKRNEPRIVEMARGLRRDLQRRLRAVYDDTGAIGKLYRRQDEIGTPYCVTVDFQSLEDQTVTVRDRDSMQQVRVSTATLGDYLGARLAGK